MRFSVYAVAVKFEQRENVIYQFLTLNPRSPVATSNETGPAKRKRLPLEDEISYFGLASALDFFMTFILLSLENFRESNQIANYVLTHGGFAGMAIFKIVIVIAVVGIAIFIERRRKNAGRFLLIFGTVIVGCVVVYSANLYFTYSGFFE